MRVINQIIARGPHLVDTLLPTGKAMFDYQTVPVMSLGRRSPFRFTSMNHCPEVLLFFRE